MKEIIQTSKDSSQDVIIYNVQQKRCWALVVEKLQEYISKNIDWMNVSREDLSKIIPLNNNFEYECELQIKDVEKVHTSKAFEQLEKMLYIIVRPQISEGKYSFVMFNSIYLNGTKVVATLPVSSLRWILDFGQKHMFVSFHQPSFLKLTTNYSMDLFLLLSENYKRGVFEIGLEDFKKRLGCPENYDADKIRTKVLKPAQREYFNKQTLLTFQYTFYSKDDKPSTQGRKRLNMIQFGILRRNYEENSVEPTNEEAWTKIHK